MSRNPFTEAFEVAYENSIFEKYKKPETLETGDISQAAIERIEGLKNSADFASDQAVYALMAMGELISMALSDSNEDDVMGRNLWRAGELISDLAGAVEHYQGTSAHLGYVLKTIDDIKTGVYKPAR